MIKFLANVLAFLAIVAAAIFGGIKHGPIFALYVAVIGSAAIHALFHGTRSDGRLCTATLILPILTGKVIEAFKVKTRAISYFSTDFGLANGDFAQPVKWNQEVLSQLAQIPTVSDHTPGEDMTTGAQNVKDLLTDVRLKINRAKKVVLKLPQADAVALELDGAFQSALAEGGEALGRAVVTDALNEINPDNFSLSITETLTNSDLDTLKAGRIKLNSHGALQPRYGLAGSEFVGYVADDSRVASGDYHGQQQGADVYQTLVNIQGLSELSEHPGFPDGLQLVGTFVGSAAADTLTLVAHSLLNGDRVRLTNTGGALPTGLAIDTSYFVVGKTADTIQLSATSGGAAINLTGDGTGTTKVYIYGALNAFLFEKRAIHIAVRQLIDNLTMAEKLGIPVPIAHHAETDSETGLTFHAFMWVDVKTHDIYVAFTIAYGIKAGRAMAADADTDPGSLAAGSGMDYAGVRVVQE